MTTTEIPNWLEQRAFLTPDRIAIKTETKEITFLQLHNHALKKANQLTYAGVKKNDVVAILMKNSIEMIEVIHALKYIGVITVLLNTKLSNQEIEWQLIDSKTNMLITEASFHEKTIHFDKNRLFIEDMPSLPEKAFEVEKTFSIEKTDTIMYTSGTTGQPKGVMQSYGNHWWSAIGSSLNLGLHQDDRWLAIVPFFHISGLSILYKSVIYGITAVIHEGFDAKKANDAIMKYGVTIVSVVSVTLTRMIEELAGRTYPKSFRCALLGGGPAPKPLLEACIEHQIPVFQTYGMTETASQVVTLSPEYSISKLGSAGKPLFPVQIKIERDGIIAEPNESGEIVVKGPNVSIGYFNRPDATSEAIKDGWLYTGDIGYVDDEGFLFVQDRRSDLIISGGENVYPAEIEAILLSHPHITEAGVTGVEDKQWGQVPIAFIKLAEEGILNTDDVIYFCEGKLARYKIPKSIYIVDTLPRNASNKLLRRKLIELIEG
ncbi:o-succinylbenzoate--CoA ligase [Fredinandcohnia quinoae]|uniref:2-succinylbenzoate--CoA ligase n=1 Tax=Fredinandcohnia quinoae TaxID=2918902 RepID=A0AAW5E729_9BACI|nr:o-succinylbenzoate--CoA ligase [Fredinandcohnia sp. SECRCQ15]MCH1625435.1 o-succinylbenzoate--CoA ligase [Fredinandcohnia sp. SECRCQ15]